MNQPNPSPEEFQLYHVGPEGDALTLSAYLKKLFPDQSWGQVKQKLAGRFVQVNGNLCLDEARRIKAKDVVKIWNRPRPKPIDASILKLVYVDPFLVVVDKPAGVTSVRHFEERNLSKVRRQLQPTLDELLPEALSRYLSRKTPPNSGLDRRPRSQDRFKSGLRSSDNRRLPTIIAVHRLDRETSGLMIFARTPSTAEALGKMFRKHTIDRRYWAVAHGQVGPQKIESHMIRDVGDGRRGSTSDPNQDGAQLAITHIRPLEQLGEYTIVECRLETGRTHQIRIHLAESGHRICGETIYNRDADGKVLIDSSGAPRQALHSASLSLTHPMTNEKLEFTAPWPNDLYRWLRELRK